MESIYLLALVLWLVVVITIVVEGYSHRFRTFLKPKKENSSSFWDPIPYPEMGEDEEFCGLCHGRIGTEPLALCSCGKKYHLSCVELSPCPVCGNDGPHMHLRRPLIISCPICLRTAPGGHCEHCGIVIPRRDGSFRCGHCGTVVFSSDPTCRKCGTAYSARTTKGYMDKVR